ncbi:MULTISPECIES: hypothetical protein [unclassified Halobacteriovorax]|uniref:hypothetical protein n=1 Tax=unclassified Halobacteriovorax TaxID=2639665 RepID=UPI003999760F
MVKKILNNILTCSFILLSFCIFINPAKAKVEEPNYDFTFDKFKPFYPGQKLSDIKNEYKAIRLINDKKPLATYEIQIRHQSYFFPVFIHVRDEVVLDFYARLPNYFLHNTFHQSLINRYGKQDKFINNDGTSVYIWNDEAGFTITYTGACTITCFPIFIHMIKKDDVKNKDSFLIKLLKN